MTLLATAMELWANLGPTVGYRVTTSAESARWYALVVGFSLGLAILAGGYWLRSRARFGKAGRTLIWVFAGSLSICWAAVWVWQHSGREVLVPVGGVWNLAVDLPLIWFALLGVLLLAVALRVAPRS